MSSSSSSNKDGPGNKQISQQKLHFHRQEVVDHVTFLILGNLITAILSLLWKSSDVVQTT